MVEFHDLPQSVPANGRNRETFGSHSVLTRYSRGSNHECFHDVVNVHQIEKLLASKCGNYGTLLVGIDKDTKTAHWYAVGRANGTATVISHVSSSVGSYKAPAYFRWGSTPDIDPLNGE